MPREPSTRSCLCWYLRLPNSPASEGPCSRAAGLLLQAAVSLCFNLKEFYRETLSHAPGAVEMPHLEEMLPQAAQYSVPVCSVPPQDHTKVILCPLMAAVTYIDEKRDFRTYKLSLLEEHGCCRELASRLRYARTMVEKLLSSKSGSGRMKAST